MEASIETLHEITVGLRKATPDLDRIKSSAQNPRDSNQSYSPYILLAMHEIVTERLQEQMKTPFLTIDLGVLTRWGRQHDDKLTGIP